MKWLLDLFGLDWEERTNANRKKEVSTKKEGESKSSAANPNSREVAMQADKFIREKLAEGYELPETLSVVYAGELARLVTYYKLGRQGQTKDENINLILEAAKDGRIDYFKKRQDAE